MNVTRIVFPQAASHERDWRDFSPPFLLVVVLVIVLDFHSSDFEDEHENEED
jgi:hypothetical protein